MSAGRLVRAIRQAVSASSASQHHSIHSKSPLFRWRPSDDQAKCDTSFRELLNPDTEFVRDQLRPFTSFLPSLPNYRRECSSSLHCRLLSSATEATATQTSSDRNKASSAFTSASDADDVRSIAPSRTASDGTAPRFYRRASAAPAADGNGWVVKLDHRVLKTPAKKPMKLPTEALALAIAAEWEWQEGRTLRPYTMPLMKLAATAIDQIPVDRERVIHTLLKYFHSDSLLCRAEEGSALGEKQAVVWDPLLDWIRDEVGERPSTTSSIFLTNQSDALVAALKAELEKADDWQLAAIDSLSGTARSLTVAFAVARGRVDVIGAKEAIRLEEDFQVEEWGFVEGGHDIDIADLHVRLAAPSVFLRLLELRVRVASR